MNPIQYIRYYFQSKFPFFVPIEKRKQTLALLFFLLFATIINILLCESIYFLPLYSADQLYTPLIVKDLISGFGIKHWIFPPSPYFFPDIALMAFLYWFFPYLYLPTIYGVMQMVLVYLGLYSVMLYFLSKKETIQFLFWFQIAITTFSILGSLLTDKPLPFVYFYSNAHHSTGFFYSLFLVCLYYNSQSNSKTNLVKKEIQIQRSKFWKYVSQVFFLLGFSLLYISDRFSFCIGMFCFFVIRTLDKEPGDWKNSLGRKQFISLSFMLIYIIGLEFIFYFLKSNLQIPNSFGILLGSLDRKTIDEITFLTINYVYDFGKQMYYQNRSLISFSVVLLFAFPKFPHRLKKLMMVLLPILIVLLVLVGRFTYLHPYPIRYLFPFWFFGILGISLVLTKETRSLPLPILISALSLCILSLCIFPKPREFTKRFHESIRNSEVPYELEKPIRFWTEGKQNPIPVGEDGKPYRWITGAFHTP